MKKVSWYWTMIKWIDPNGYGIISEYVFKAQNSLIAQKKAQDAFYVHAKKLYGEGWESTEIRKIDTSKMVIGLHNQRKWNNPK